MKSSMYAWSAAVVLTVGAACAHEGPRVWLDQSGGRVITLTSDNDISPTVFAPARAFLGELTPLFGVLTTEFPGYEVKPVAPAVGAGTVFGFRVAGPLLSYDVATDRLRPTVEFLPAPAPQLAVSFAAEVRMTDRGPVDGFDFFQYFGGGDHAHLSFTLLGDGASPTAPAPPDGTYVLPMITTAGGLAPSDWYFIVLSKSATVVARDRSLALAESMAESLPGDANFDRSVNIGDFAVLAANFNAGNRWWGDGDFNFDGTVGIADFALLAANFNRTQPTDGPRAAVPDPTGGASIGAGLIVATVRRRASPVATRPSE